MISHHVVPFERFFKYAGGGALDDARRNTVRGLELENNRRGLSPGAHMTVADLCGDEPVYRFFINSRQTRASSRPQTQKRGRRRPERLCFPDARSESRLKEGRQKDARELSKPGQLEPRASLTFGRSEAWRARRFPSRIGEGEGLQLRRWEGIDRYRTGWCRVIEKHSGAVIASSSNKHAKEQRRHLSIRHQFQMMKPRI